MKDDKHNENEVEKFYSLMQKIHDDPEEGLREFYEKYYSYICSVVQLSRYPMITADEILLEVLYSIWREANKPLKVIEKPKGWIRVIAVNKLNSILRKHRDKQLDKDVAAPNVEMEKLLATAAYNYMVRNLSGKEKEIVEQKILNKATFEEIAKDMNLSIGTVSSIYYRALKKVEKDFEKDQKNEKKMTFVCVK